MTPQQRAYNKKYDAKTQYTTVEEANENRCFAVYYLILLIIVMLDLV